jgi:hypothetical protein
LIEARGSRVFSFDINVEAASNASFTLVYEQMLLRRDNQYVIPFRRHQQHHVYLSQWVSHLIGILHHLLLGFTGTHCNCIRSLDKYAVHHI